MELLKKLIQFKSITSSIEENVATLEFLDGYLADSTIFKFENNGFHSRLYTNTDKNFKDESYKIILNAHVDVVQANEEQYTPKIEDGKLYGRGAYDMKAGAAAEIEVFKELSKKVAFPIALQIVTDEETGGFNCTKYQVEEGVKGEFVIVGEPTNLKIKHKAKGIIWLKVVSKGTAAHAAYPWDGQNANSKLLKFLNGLEKLIPNPETEGWQTTMNISFIKNANEAFNKIPDFAECGVDIRYIPEDKDLVDQIQKIGKDTDVEVEVVTNEPSHFADPSDTKIQKLLGINEKHSGIKKEDALIYAHGGSDLRFYSKLSIPAVEFGPTGAGHHSDSEWVDLKSIETYQEVLKQFILAL